MAIVQQGGPRHESDRDLSSIEVWQVVQQGVANGVELCGGGAMKGRGMHGPHGTIGKGDVVAPVGDAQRRLG